MSRRNYSTVQVDFMQNNNEYSNQFRHGSLALPPAKGYAIGEASPELRRGRMRDPLWNVN